MAYGVNLNDACFRWDRFIFGRGPGGEAMACHWINNQIYPRRLGLTARGCRLLADLSEAVRGSGDRTPCPGSQAAAQSPDGLPMLCLGAQGLAAGLQGRRLGQRKLLRTG